MHAAIRGQTHAQRTYVAGDEYVFERSGDHFVGQLNASLVDLGHFVGQTMLGQLEAVGAKCIGLYHLRSGVDVIGVHLGYQGGAFYIQRFKAAFYLGAVLMQQGAHGAI
ncbi:hypothetical protein SDC9_95092 [bioreactor metagenome]|uniref:Uncharacterized protein n=1 Tax=bioreactor metagenome TaxID=1076179 RepID=A0A645A6M8_9ZZZZ